MGDAHERGPCGIPKEPLVSIIIPAYQVASFIKEALDSVFAQTIISYEAIVINDGSPDTLELERTLAPYRSRILYIQQDNRGAGAARNAGLRAARGRFVAFLDGDDVWLPNFLSEQLKLIESDGGYDLVYADAVNFGDLDSAGRTSMATNPSSGEVTVEKLIRSLCCVITSAVLARRESLLAAGLFDETLHNSQDFDFWLRLAKDARARITYQRKVLVLRRIHPESLAYDPTKSFAGELRVLNKMSLRDDLTPEERDAIAATISQRQAEVAVINGKRALADEDFAAAARSFQIANENLRSWKLGLVLLWLRVAPGLLRRVYRRRPT